MEEASAGDFSTQTKGEKVLKTAVLTACRLVKSMSFAAMLILSVACTGCAQIVYDSLQNSQSRDCQRMQGRADRDECQRRSDMSYDEYRR